MVAAMIRRHAPSQHKCVCRHWGPRSRRADRRFGPGCGLIEMPARAGPHPQLSGIATFAGQTHHSHRDQSGDDRRDEDHTAPAPTFAFVGGGLLLWAPTGLGWVFSAAEEVRPVACPAGPRRWAKAIGAQVSRSDWLRALSRIQNRYAAIRGCLAGRDGQCWLVQNFRFLERCSRGLSPAFIRLKTTQPPNQGASVFLGPVSACACIQVSIAYLPEAPLQVFPRQSQTSGFQAFGLLQLMAFQAFHTHRAHQGCVFRHLGQL